MLLVLCTLSTSYNEYERMLPRKIMVKYYVEEILGKGLLKKKSQFFNNFYNFLTKTGYYPDAEKL